MNNWQNFEFWDWRSDPWITCHTAIVISCFFSDSNPGHGGAHSDSVQQMYRQRFLLLLLYHTAQPSQGGQANEASQRAKRILNLFNIVKFPNDVCSSSDSNNKYGTCYTASECSAAGATDVNWMFGKSEMSEKYIIVIYLSRRRLLG